MKTKFKTTKKDMDLIFEILDRSGSALNIPGDRFSQFMDLEHTHAERPLNLARLLDFPDFDFAHDMWGIYTNFNRETLSMDNCFLPRCTSS